jgi:hypothetical protein
MEPQINTDEHRFFLLGSHSACIGLLEPRKVVFICVLFCILRILHVALVFFAVDVMRSRDGMGPFL